MLRLRAEISQALKAGFTMRAVWQTLSESGEIDIGYASFARWTRELVRSPGAEATPTSPSPAPPAPQASALPQPKSPEREQATEAGEKPPAPKPSRLASQRRYLEVPLVERGVAQEFGAQWDEDKKQLYIEAGADLGTFARWLPEGDPDANPRSQLPGLRRFIHNPVPDLKKIYGED